MESKIYKTFETERLILKPTTTEEADFVYSLLNSPHWIKYIGDRKVYSVADAEAYITARMTPHLETYGFGNYTLIRKLDGVLIGTTGVYSRVGLGAMDIGFALLPEYEGLGYGYESASVLIKAAFTEFGLTELLAITATDNYASQRLLSKLGLVYDSKIVMPGETESMLLYKIQKPSLL